MTILTVTLLVEDSDKAMELQLALHAYLSRVQRIAAVTAQDSYLKAAYGDFDAGVVARLSKAVSGVEIISIDSTEVKP